MHRKKILSFFLFFSFLHFCVANHNNILLHIMKQSWSSMMTVMMMMMMERRRQQRWREHKNLPFKTHKIDRFSWNGAQKNTQKEKRRKKIARNETKDMHTYTEKKKSKNFVLVLIPRRRLPLAYFFSSSSSSFLKAQFTNLLPWSVGT